MLALTPLCNQPPLGGLSELCVVVVSKAPFHFRAATHTVSVSALVVSWRHETRGWLESTSDLSRLYAPNSQDYLLYSS